MTTTQSPLQQWLEGIVCHYWGRQTQSPPIIYQVRVTEDDYDTLETRLSKKFVNRHKDEYDVIRDGLRSDKLKLECLSSLKKYPEDEDGDENEDTDSFTILDMRDTSDSIVKDPFNVPVVLVRQEYKIFAKLVMEGLENTFVTGQPGIGKTYFLYFLLVSFVLQSRPFIFVSEGIQWYIRDGGVSETAHVPFPTKAKEKWSHDPLVILIDGDCGKNQYRQEFRASDYRVIMVSSPRGGQHRKWVKQKPSTQELVMKGWSMKELRFASSFLYQYDITPSRLANSIRLFGYSPRVCFAAATGSMSATVALNKLKSAVREVPDISTALMSCRDGSSVSHTVFEVIPKDEQRLWDCVVVHPVSRLALDMLLHDQAERLPKQSVYNLYSMLRRLPEAESFIGMTWECVLHRYLSQVQGDFELTPLHPSHPPYTLHLPKPSHIHANCSTDAAFRSTLSKAFDSDGTVSQSCYAYPDCPNFATFDSVAIVGSDFLCFHMALGTAHQMKLSSLQRTQQWLKMGTPLEKFRPGKGNRWNIIFVVPSRLKGSFLRQNKALTLPQETKPQTLTSTFEEGCSKRQGHEEDPGIANPDSGDSGNWESWLYQYAWFVEEKDVFAVYAAYLEDFEGASPTYV
ncbi:hypothetical protein ARMSODRAFT_1090328 [Armillaria solidipes]|uniref:Crinkler family protein n=1 Tax=Armillaria solidipes TaxID=1076256 RepID=A0A2H3ANS8_9AGAR|nr:hypothetical protein ARMSODRAFT_1090328 [Armillaria solidipes]